MPPEKFVGAQRRRRWFCILLRGKIQRAACVKEYDGDFWGCGSDFFCSFLLCMPGKYCKIDLIPGGFKLMVWRYCRV